MWYEIIPSLTIVGIGVTFPTIFAFYFQKFIQNGNPYKRFLCPNFNRDLYLRDVRLTGNAYKHLGLENIPDEPSE